MKRAAGLRPRSFHAGASAPGANPLPLRRMVGEYVPGPGSSVAPICFFGDACCPDMPPLRGL
eukprot:scaffold39923_cov64-Phaeocystis_antarctica.AAC.11